jgi:tRNA dimethylallyltransferase
MQSIGYRHMLHYLSGELSWDEAIRTMKRDTRRYAKRQMTWFRKDPAIEWIEKDDKETALKRIRHFLRSPQ